jgi:hypothetical protein
VSRCHLGTVWRWQLRSVAVWGVAASEVATVCCIALVREQ